MRIESYHRRSILWLGMGCFPLFGCQKGEIPANPAKLPAIVEFREEPETELSDRSFEEETDVALTEEPELLDVNRLYEPPPRVKISSDFDLEEAILAGEPLGVICYLPVQPEDHYLIFALLDVMEWVNKQLAKVLPE